MKNFNDFFDIYNVEHLAAYEHLSETGIWPKGFIPEDCELPHLWISNIQSRMSDAYIKLGMSGKIFGMPATNSLKKECLLEEK